MELTVTRHHRLKQNLKLLDVFLCKMCLYKYNDEQIYLSTEFVKNYNSSFGHRI